MTPQLFAPPAYRAADPVAIVRAYPFALLTTVDAGEVHATSTPIFFERDDSTDMLVGHLARRNPHAAVLAAGQKTLVVFSGPHAYVSPRWYVEKPEVPTWDYVAAHVRGILEPIDDDAGQRAVLARTAERLEHGAADPWTLGHAPEGRVAFLLPMIRSFRIRIESIEGVTKLSQTHPASDRARIVNGLMQDDEGKAIARLIAALPDA
jgi:transcriptional regulator